MILPEDIFVVVLEKDLSDAQSLLDPDHETDSVVAETPIRLATKKHAAGLIRRFERGGHGDCLVGRVSFIDSDQLRVHPLAVAALPDNDSINSFLDTLRPGFGKLSNVEQSRQRFEVLQWVKAL